MKFLHVISSLDPKQGGPVEGIKQLCPALARQGVAVDVVCGDRPDAPWLAVGEFKNVYALGPSKFGYGYNGRLVGWLRDNAANYDAVIVEGIWQYHSLATWRALAGSDVPYFVFMHGMLDPWFKRAYPLKHLKKWLYWPWAEYRVLRDARAVIFTCQDERILARHSFWLYRVREAVTSYGTSEPPQDAQGLSELFLEAHPHLRGKRLLLFLSRIQEKKGCDLLIDAFAACASVDDRLHLVMAGPDQTGWVRVLQGQADRLGIAHRLSWVGMVQGNIKWGAFHAAEAFCLPSHQENFGIVVAEALACGKPVLISDKVNIWREIEEDGAGFVGSDTIEGTMRSLQHWLELNAQQRETMAQKARDCFVKRFQIDNAATRLITIIRQAIQKG